MKHSICKYFYYFMFFLLLITLVSAIDFQTPLESLYFRNLRITLDMQWGEKLDMYKEELDLTKELIKLDKLLYDH